MRAPTRLAAVTLLLLTSLYGCGEPTSEPDQAELDRLRSLPYVGSTPILPGNEQEGVVLHDEARSYPGYTLYTVQNLAMTILILWNPDMHFLIPCLSDGLLRSIREKG